MDPFSAYFLAPININDKSRLPKGFPFGYANYIPLILCEQEITFLERGEKGDSGEGTAPRPDASACPMQASSMTIDEREIPLNLPYK
jgi:hypothetical protein